MRDGTLWHPATKAIHGANLARLVLALKQMSSKLMLFRLFYPNKWKCHYQCIITVVLKEIHHTMRAKTKGGDKMMMMRAAAMMKMTNAMTEKYQNKWRRFYSRVFDTFFVSLYLFAILMIRTMESDFILSLHDVYLLIRQN